MQDRRFVYQMLGWLALGTALFFSLALLQTANAQSPAASAEVRVDWNADPMAGFSAALSERRGETERQPQEKRAWGRERLEAQARAERQPPQAVAGAAVTDAPVEISAAVWQGPAAPAALAHNRNPGHGGRDRSHGGHNYGGTPYGYRPIPQVPWGYYRPPTYQDPTHRWRSPYDNHAGPHNGAHYGWFPGPDGRMYWGPHQGTHWGDHGPGGHFNQPWPYPYRR